jgi:hypothetical protein
MNPRVLALHVWPAGDGGPAPVEELALDWGGPVGDRHHGETMSSDTRQKSVFARGTTIRNHRQVSLVDAAELTGLPRMTRLAFDGGVVLMCGGENMPCTVAGTMVGAAHGTSPTAFPKAAIGHRGVTAWVEHPGVIRPGEGIRVLTP